jgi:hypothetical protein
LEIDYSSVIPTAIAVGGLVFAGITFWRDSQVRQLQIADDIFRNLQRLVRQLSDIVPKEVTDTVDKTKLSAWEDEFFNELEWLSFIINNKKLKEERLVLFFKGAIIGWYEDIFCKYATTEERNNPLLYAELKKLYQKWKKK